MLRLRLLSLIAPVALAAACATSIEDDATGDGERGPIGKADLIGSCADAEGGDFCGHKSEGNCWCDEVCTQFGDCCEDVEEVCEEDICDGLVVCALFCENGFDTDENGCEICSCKPQFCGGIAALPCPAGQICVGMGDFPDAGGHCEPIIECAGFLGLQCPEGLECVDFPGDSCDPQNGGADCGGMCVEPAPQPATCEDHCGGPGSDGSCYCDDVCSVFGDCCEDFEDACTAPAASCGDASCSADEVCVESIQQIGIFFECVSIPDSCDGDATCGCMGDEACGGSPFVCLDVEDGLSCHCPVC